MCVCSPSHVDSFAFVCACVCVVSEPTLKWKIKKMISARPNPLQRKISAPPTVRHRTEPLGNPSTFRPSVSHHPRDVRGLFFIRFCPDASHWCRPDSSSNSSSTSASGCSSPNDSHSDSSSLAHEVGASVMFRFVSSIEFISCVYLSACCVIQRAETLSMSQAQRLLLKDGNLAHFTLSPSSTTMPNITAGLPAQVIKYTY